MNVSIILVSNQSEHLVDDEVNDEDVHEAHRQIIINELVKTIEDTKESLNTFIHEDMQSSIREDIRYNRELNRAAHTVLQYFTTREEYNELVIN